MKANYHTHTIRCGHAEGTDEAYIQAALDQGFDELGFSDHMPWPYKSGFFNQGVRMHISQMEDYIKSIRALEEKYRDRISIKLGFECEYFPEYMGFLQDVYEENHLDYLILGNHYENTDEGGFYFGGAKTGAELARYVDCAVKGMDTGLFIYLAHPDLFMRKYPTFDENCCAAAHDLCQACKAKNLPMEYNVHDRFISYLTHRKSYPHPKFFEIALEEGVQVLIGLDAHEPKEISDPTQWDRAMKELEVFGDKHIDHLTF